jgi:hypothetical protein
MTNQFAEQPKPYKPPPPHADDTLKCVACHKVLLTPPTGKTAGLCPQMQCLAPGEATPERLRDYVNFMRLVMIGRMVFEYEPETYVYWFWQKPIEAPRPRPVSYDDDETPRYLDTASPHGQTIRPGIDHGIGGDDDLYGVIKDG